MTRRTLSHHIILPPFDDGLPDTVSRISQAVFGSAEPHRIRWRLTHMPDASVLEGSTPSWSLAEAPLMIRVPGQWVLRKATGLWKVQR